MPKQDRLYVNKLWILRCFIIFSYEVKARRRTYFCLKPSDFRKREVFEENPETGKKEKITVSTLSRKIFQKFVKELLEEKLITRIKTSDRRSIYYSITPLGICYLIKSELFRDPLKIHYKEIEPIFHILESFAKIPVTPYKSQIFEKEEFYFDNFYEHLINTVIDPHNLGEEMPYVFSNFDFDSQIQRLEFSFEFFVEGSLKIVIANFRDIGKQDIILSELGQKEGFLSKYEPIELNEDQFHHYLAKLLIFLTVYFHFQIRHLPKPSKKIKQEIISDYKNLPDYILKILFIFNRCIGEKIKEEAEYMNNFTEIVNRC